MRRGLNPNAAMGGTGSCAHRAAGFTLVEVLVATVLVGVAVISGTWTISSAAKNQQTLADQSVTAPHIAREIYELAKTLPKEPSGVLAAQTVASLQALDSLSGAKFSPPILANMATSAFGAEWEQVVQVEVVSLDNPTARTGEAAWLGLDKFSRRLYELTVTVKKDGSVVGAFSWWLTP